MTAQVYGDDGEFILQTIHVTSLVPFDAVTASAMQEQDGRTCAAYIKSDAG
jgi:hypothetical protein